MERGSERRRRARPLRLGQTPVSLCPAALVELRTPILGVLAQANELGDSTGLDVLNRADDGTSVEQIDDAVLLLGLCDKSTRALHVLEPSLLGRLAVAQPD